MRKFTFLLVAAVMAVGANAQGTQSLGNPTNINNLYDVVWDCGNQEFKSDYEIQFDETFTFAVDITGTPLLAWVNEASPVAGATRSIGLKIYSDVGGNGPKDMVDAAYRLTRIKGNIFGATWNINQLAGAINADAAKVPGTETYFYGVLFGYAYTSTEGGAEWWQSAVDVKGPGEPGSPIFRAAAYNGSHASDPIFNMTQSTLSPFKTWDIDGWLHQCEVISSGIEEIFATPQEIERIEYFNLQGIKLQGEPKEGLFIAVPYYKNGVRGEAQKVINSK